LREILVFFGIRFVSFFISTYVMFLCINRAHLDHQLAKMAGVVIEVALNYFNCKLFVFKKK
ncbi:MAG: GtrA family protein, partial [Oscillospiraceae bacterium]|nr:GtrA family protein [Oscillospiraceae bacterium]